MNETEKKRIISIWGIVISLVLIVVALWFLHEVLVRQQQEELIETKKIIENLEEKLATPSATLTPTITPRSIIKQNTPIPTQTNPTNAPPVPPQTINNTTIVNPTSAPEPTSVPEQPQPTPEERRCIINLLGVEVCL